MPPPPPPSASYLWKFDDIETDDEVDPSSEEEVVVNNNNRVFTATTRHDEIWKNNNNKEDETCNTEETLSEFALSSDSQFDDDLDDEFDEEQEINTTATTKKVKKKRKKRKKKKKNQNQQQQPLQSKRVSFGTVNIKFYERCLGTDVVPLDGGWPLGFGAPISLDHDSINSIPIDEYEVFKQQRLRERLEHYRCKAHQENNNNNNDLTTNTNDTNKFTSTLLDCLAGQEYLETRQWDYKRKTKNPLFALVPEQDRMRILLEASTNENKDKAALCHQQNNESSSNRRSISKNLHDSFRQSDSSISRTRSRSGSFTEHYNEKYTQIEVHHVRNELEQIRNNRTMEGSLGCTCRKLQVYLLPPNAGKKAHKRRLNLPKVKEELRKRHKLPSNHNAMSREELELLLHDIVEKEPCCSSNDCPCAREGIDCQADACNCWYDSHQTKEHQHLHLRATANEIRNRCGNNMNVVDIDKIDNFRKKFLNPMTVCPVIGNNSNNSNTIGQDNGGYGSMLVEAEA